MSVSPGSSNSADIGLIERQGHFGAVERLIGSVPLDFACFSRLLARLAKVRVWTYSKWVPMGGGGDWGSEWHWQVTQRQEVVGLLLGAASDRGHHELVTALRGHSALRPIPWKPSRVETEVGEVTQGGMPPYPEGAAYQPWSPSAQDAWADKISAATSERISAAIRQGRGL